MIIYFANRNLEILGKASTGLPKGMTIVDDLKVEDVETGIATFEVTIGFDESTRLDAEEWTEVGNYILRSNEDESEFYTITDVEIDTKSQEINVYAEDAGLDLINEVVGPYSADKSYNIKHYIDKFAGPSGFELGIDETGDMTRKLSWDNEETVTERLENVVKRFNNYELSFSYEIKGLTITKMYINVHEKRGENTRCQLRLNKEVDRIVTKKSVNNLATALEVKGGVPKGGKTPINLKGYKYDDGDFYVEGTRLYSREALKRWGRMPIGDRSNIFRKFSYNTENQKTLCEHAIAELKKLRNMEINFEVDVKRFPDNTKIGDRINIIDDAGELYLSTRILKFETSVTQETQKATLGENLLRNSGISQKVQDLAEEFAQKAEEIKNAYDSVSLKIFSSNGTAFKNNNVATELTVMINTNTDTITDTAALVELLGENAKLVWEEKKSGQSSYTPIDDSDPRVSNGGFSLIISAKDVVKQTVFSCRLEM